MAKKTAAKKPKTLTWPNGKKVAVSITVMFETWPDDSAPSYSVQTTHLKKGTVDHAAKAWSTYGGRVGVWRLIRTFERLGMPATFFVNARCTEVYPDAVKQIAGSGFDLAAPLLHAGRPARYLPPEQQATDPQEHRPAGSRAAARRSPAGAARWWRSPRRPRASSSRTG